ncbi:MAG TPA: DUF1501 domain-containing protein [Campylobacterales bacterium]|nr:DUF1501 domain-containing protein [Campylobacterales bacterium]
MKRRNFIKLSLATGTALLAPSFSSAADVDISGVRFNANTYNTNNAQTIMIFLYGGPSELSANISNMPEIKEASQSNYDAYFRGITPTANNFWQEAGGTFMEELVSSGDLNVFRTCYSAHREETNNKSHGECVAQNQRGAFREEGSGVFTTLAQILEKNGVIDENTVLPFITIKGESALYAKGDKPLSGYLNPVGVNQNLDNPYERSSDNRWYYYTEAEREVDDYDHNTTASMNSAMDTLAQTQNQEGQIKEAFKKRGELEAFINQIKEKDLPEGVTYPNNNSFGEKLQTSINILSANPDTKVISLGNDGLGGWDDHNDARDYITRMETLFSALSAATAHIKAEGKENNISIMIFGDFGRNVNLNSALGWDHGNNQNFFLLGGKGFFNSLGVVGETELYNPNRLNRLYLKPKASSYAFEPLSVAATLYKIYGVENPEVLTGGHKAIEAGLFK